jgi:hypothetical protein
MLMYCVFVYENIQVYMCVCVMIMYVCESEELIIDNFYLRNRDGRLPLHFAATNTSVEKVKSLLGAYPNAGGHRRNIFLQ